jgi:oxygen-dependent protoporphyrinogen oxidase
MSRRVVVVGAGPAGLTVAFRLKQLSPACAVTVLEPRAAPGGNVGTVAANGFRVEVGPNGFLDAKPSTLELARDLGLGGELVAASEGSRQNRFVYHAGRIERLPGSPLGLLTSPLLSAAGKVSLLREPFRRKQLRPGESVAAFARRRFGREAASAFLDPLVTGIHAADPESLEVAAAFPRLVRFERDHGSVVRGFLKSLKQRKADGAGPQRMWSFRGGLQVLIDALRERVADSLICGVTVKRVVRTAGGWRVHGDGHDSWPADAVVVAAPAFAQAAMLADLDATLAADLAGIAYTPVAVVALGYRVEDTAGVPDGFGYIAAGRLRRDVLGVQWCSSIFPERAPPGFVLWRALCGGAFRPELVSLPDEELVRRVHAELRHALKVRGEPAFVRVVKWPAAIPQYRVGHVERVAGIEAAAARHPGLFLTGNALHGVALNDVTEQAARVAVTASGAGG